MSRNSNKLSIVIPTLNCAGMIGEHIESMRSWLDLAGEVIVIDSYSEDGTAQLIQQQLQHPQLRILSHPRGLYQSWNHAIAQTTGDWIYLATVGDSIQRAQLEHLLAAGNALCSDVVASPPSFVFEECQESASPVWPIARILKDYHITKPTQISSLAAFYYALECIPNAILGSSASNLYRGDHLRVRPFPTEYSVVGDTAWALKYSLQTKYCYTDTVGSTFRFHAKTYEPPDFCKISRLCQSLLALAHQTYLDSSIAAELRPLFDQFFEPAHLLEDARARYRLARKSSRLPWYFRRDAWQARIKRNQLIRKRKDLLRLHPLILKEPVLELQQST